MVSRMEISVFPKILLFVGGAICLLVFIAIVVAVVVATTRRK
jgi:hypothetical protein